MLETVEILKYTNGQKVRYQTNFVVRSYVNLFVKKWTWLQNVEDDTIFTHQREAEDYASYVLEPWFDNHNTRSNVHWIKKTKIHDKIKAYVKSAASSGSKHWRLRFDGRYGECKYEIVRFYDFDDWLEGQPLGPDWKYNVQILLNADSMSELESKIDAYFKEREKGDKTIVSKVHFNEDNKSLVLPKAQKKREKVIETEINRTEKYLEFLKKL